MNKYEFIKLKYFFDSHNDNMSKYEFIKLMSLLGATKNNENKEYNDEITKYPYNYRGVDIVLCIIKEKVTYKPITYVEIRTQYDSLEVNSIYELICNLGVIFENIDINNTYHQFITNIIQDFLPFKTLENMEGISQEIITLINEFDKSCLITSSDKINRIDISFENDNSFSSFEVGNGIENIRVKYTTESTEIIFNSEDYTFIHTQKLDGEHSSFYFNIIDNNNEKDSMIYDLKNRKLFIGEMYKEEEISISDKKNFDKYTSLIKLGIKLVNDFYSVNNLVKNEELQNSNNII